MEHSPNVEIGDFPGQRCGYRQDVWEYVDQTVCAVGGGAPSGVSRNDIDRTHESSMRGRRALQTTSSIQPAMSRRSGRPGLRSVLEPVEDKPQDSVKMSLLTRAMRRLRYPGGEVAAARHRPRNSLGSRPPVQKGRNT